MNPAPIAELPDSNIACYEDCIRYGRLGAKQESCVPFSEIVQIYYRRSVHPFAIATLIISGVVTLVAFGIVSSLWLRVPLAVIAAALGATGIRGFFADQVVIRKNDNKITARRCYEAREAVELFAANCATAVSAFKASR